MSLPARGAGIVRGMDVRDTDEVEHDRKIDEFQEALDEFLGQWWPAIGPHPGDGLDDEDREELGVTYCSTWVLVVGCSSIERAYQGATEHVCARFGKPRQIPWAGMGLLRDAVARWEAG